MVDILYHYTDLSGKLGIYDNNTLWLKLTSKSRNDVEDTLYIKKIVKKIQQEYDCDSTYIKRAIKVMDDVLNPIGKDKKYEFLKNNVFMFCTFGIRDDVAGRCLYDDATEVFRISFDKKKLISCLKKIADQGLYYDYFLCDNVVYSEKHLKENILSILHKYENEYKKILEKNINNVCIIDDPYLASTPSSCTSGWRSLLLIENGIWIETNNEKGTKEFVRQNEMWVQLANDFYNIAPFIKNPDFINEREFRFSFYRKSKKKEYTQLNKNYCIEVKINRECLIDCNSIGYGKKN
ncbi:hypothetical protein PTH_2194 [Pelotomaculum thermopropionicum SI]|uniref:Uncharacterized protein n=1 Tax=Pelotomaculum thermopropionicum (strain DSM 13744 / JCM 10971 / SI) TaxID=370438 RepID=A5D069_PELTS|nr:hypothetical protein PTH_2194 [Pelotomaculum thermopropionicum SI]